MQKVMEIQPIMQHNTLPETDSSHLKMDGIRRLVSLKGASSAYNFQVLVLAGWFHGRVWTKDHLMFGPSSLLFPIFFGTSLHRTGPAPGILQGTALFRQDYSHITVGGNRSSEPIAPGS